MHPGDLVLTPNWTWHDHANGTDAPMIWLDGLDTPPVRMLEGEFDEEYHTETQAVGAGVDPPPQWHYPMSQARAALERLAAERGRPRQPNRPRLHESGNRRSHHADHRVPDPVFAPGEHTQAHRRVCCANYHVIEGSGYSLVGGRRLDWDEKDVFTVPTWTYHEHVNTGDSPALLFSFTDAPVMKALDLYREEAKGAMTQMRVR
jgi:gentisate 1,2-dioxygenase